MTDTSDPNKRRMRLIIVLAVLAGAIILLLASEYGSIVPQEEPDEPTATGARDFVPELVAA